jgi:hypothetical protein
LQSAVSQLSPTADMSPIWRKFEKCHEQTKCSAAAHKAYSITSSARASSVDGTVRPSAFAVCPPMKPFPCGRPAKQRYELASLF